MIELPIWNNNTIYKLYAVIASMHAFLNNEYWRSENFEHDFPLFFM